MAANNNGVWNNIPTRIAIRITYPIWSTWYAYVVYSVIAIIAFYFFRKQAIYRQKLKLKLKLSRIHSETEEKLHQTKLQFFTNISHEFRTPLTLIQGPVNRLLKTEDQSNLSRKQLSLIKNNTDRLLRLINQFLDFRRIDHGKLKLNPIHTDIISFCKNVFDCFEEHATQRSFNFDFITEFTNLNMDFDPDKLDKVLVNILSNAFKNSADNGNIALKIKRNNKSEIKQKWTNYTIDNEILDEFVEISITDSGFGISSENLPKIFERFFQIKNEQSSNNGTGIGLSLSANYISMHKGQLVVSSLKDNGTTFFIYLPIYQ
jgi:signal transduction histidine kinase